MANLKLRYLIVTLLLAVTATIVRGVQYESSSDDAFGLAAFKAIPTKIGKWKGQDFPLDESIYGILETRAIIHRSFTAANGDIVFLSVVHYNDTKVDFHAPESCLGGEGLKTSKKNKVINLFTGVQQINLDVSELLTDRATGRTLTYYFYKSGNFIGSNYIKMRLSIAANKLARNDTSGSLIRISTTQKAGNEAKAESLLKDFLEVLFPYVQQSL